MIHEKVFDIPKYVKMLHRKDKVWLKVIISIKSVIVYVRDGETDINKYRQLE